MSVSNFFVQNTAVSFLQTASAAVQARNQSQNKPKDTDPMLDALADSSSSDKAKAFNDEQNKLNQTLQQLQSSKTGSDDQRKAAAQEKIARLKVQLQALRLLANVDPKAAAREAARLSKELSAAVKDYASASGGGMDMTASTSGASVAVMPVATAAPVTAPQEVAPATEAPVAATEDSPATASTSGEVANATVVNSSNDDKKAFRDKIDAQIAGIQKKAGDIREDNSFTMEAQRIQNELKSVLRMAKEKTSHDKPGDDEDIKAAERTMGATDDALNGLTANTVFTSAAVNITA